MICNFIVTIKFSHQADFSFEVGNLLTGKYTDKYQLFKTTPFSQYYYICQQSKSRRMFFLGLLSTPLPYLLLAAFYFFGFAMGMFNNKTGEETIESIATVSIPAEIKQKSTESTIYYYSGINFEKQGHTVALSKEDSTPQAFPDTGPTFLQSRNSLIHEIQISGFFFSRPPPSVC